jgi:hypothetical protein
VSRRTTLQSEVALVQAEIARVLCDLAEVGEDAESFLRERGGDADFVKISQSEMTQANVATVVHTNTLNPAGIAAGGAKSPSRPKSNTHRPPGGQSLSHLSEAPEKSLKASLVTSLRQATRNNKHGSQPDAVNSLMNKNRLLSELTQRLSTHESAQYFRNDIYDNAIVFSDSRARRPIGSTRNIYGENFKASLLLLWNKLPRNEEARDK